MSAPRGAAPTADPSHPPTADGRTIHVVRRSAFSPVTVGAVGHGMSASCRKRPAPPAPGMAVARHTASGAPPINPILQPPIRHQRGKKLFNRHAFTYPDDFTESVEFTAKRTADRLRLHNSWMRCFNNKTEMYNNKTFPLLSCQIYCKAQDVDVVPGAEGEKVTLYFPAEMAVVRISLDGRVHEQLNNVLPLSTVVRGDHPYVLEQQEEHGISGVESGPTYPRASRDFISDLWLQHGQLYCFKSEWLSILGALDYMELETVFHPLLIHPEINLTCVEDLIGAALSWQGLEEQQLPPVDLKQLVVKDYEDWRSALCDYHAQKLLEGPAKNARAMQHKCSLALVKGAAIFVQRYMCGLMQDKGTVLEELPSTSRSAAGSLMRDQGTAPEELPSTSLAPN